MVCPAGGPIGSVDLRVASPHSGSEPLPLHTIDRLQEGDTLLYRPLLHAGEERKGEVVIVLVPVNKTAAREKLAILDAKPDMLFLDIEMPGLNGFQATRAISRDPETQAIPVILCTSKSQETDKIWGMQQGARDYVMKPVSKDELLAKIAALG